MEWQNNRGGSVTNKNKSAFLVIIPRIVGVIGWVLVIMLSIGYIQPLKKPEETITPPDEPFSVHSPVPNDPVNLVSPHYPLAKAGDEGWDYHRVLVEDLNGDGRDDTVHVIAKIERHHTNPSEFLWDDGHIWQVYVEDADGQLTYVFSNWVQLGQLRVVSPDYFAYPDMKGIGIINEQGAGITLYHVRYIGPNDFSSHRLGSMPILREAGSL